MGSPCGIDDKRCAVDIAISKESLRRIGATLRWGLTSLVLADCLTKDKAEPADLLKAVVGVDSINWPTRAAFWLKPPPSALYGSKLPHAICHHRMVKVEAKNNPKG
eukprot:5601422-Pyramimonas_sp.AAC.1